MNIDTGRDRGTIIDVLVPLRASGPELGTPSATETRNHGETDDQNSGG